MIGHPVLETTALVDSCTDEPAGAAAPTGTFIDLVCADHDLLAAEFTAIIAANFAAVAGTGCRLPRAGTTRTATSVVVRRRGPGFLEQPVQGRAANRTDPRARQRSPPTRTSCTTYATEPGSRASIQEMSICAAGKGGGGIDQHDADMTRHATTGSDHPDDHRGVHVLLATSDARPLRSGRAR